MAFGILEPARQDGSTAVPGSLLLHPAAEGDSLSDCHIGPTSSRLHLSKTRKELYFLVLLFGACITGAIGPVIVPAFGLVANDLGVTLQRVTLLNGALIMALGVGSYVLAVLANVIGRRLLFLGTSILLVAACVWAALAASYGALMGARVLQGLAMGSFFSVGGTTSIHDVFAVHERGRRAGLWNFAVLFAVNLTPVVSGYLVMALSWRWAFWVLAIGSGVALVLVWLFYPEAHMRENLQPTARVKDVEGEATSASPPSGEGKDKGKGKGKCKSKEHVAADASPPPPSIASVAEGSSSVTPSRSALLRMRAALGIEEVRFGTWRDLFAGLVKPIALLRHGVAIWGCLLWSIIFTWVIILGAVADQVFAVPPYSLDPSQVGVLVGVAPLIGSTMGTVFAGWATDAAVSLLSSRNSGRFEPEYRLVAMVPCFLGVVAGSFGLGIAIRNGLPPLVCGVFLVLLNLGVGCGCTAIVAYTNDVCMEWAGEVFGLAMVTKSAFAFGLSFFINDFYAHHGPVVFFATWGGLSAAGCLGTVPMYVMGKRLRARM